jgi:myb proto-oncogene protein
LADLQQAPSAELDSKEREDDFIGCEEPWFSGMAGVGSGFTGMLFDVSNEHDASECWGESNNGQTEHSNQASDEEDKNYWNGVIDMVNSELTPQSPPLV